MDYNGYDWGYLNFNISNCQLGNLSVSLNVNFGNTTIGTATVVTPGVDVVSFNWSNYTCGDSCGGGDFWTFSVDSGAATEVNWTSGLNIFNLLSSAALAQHPQSAILSGIASQLDGIAANYQQQLYGQIAADFQSVGSTQSAGQFLTGTKLLLQSYSTFGLPGFLESDDTLQGLLYGATAIPDAAKVQSDFSSFATTAIANTTDNRITDEVNLLNSRSSALGSEFSAALNAIQLRGSPDSLIQVDTTLRDLQTFEQVKNANALSPCLYTLSAPVSFLTAVGGTVSTQVQVPQTCTWSATTGAPWLSVTSGQAGTGDGSVFVVAAPNIAGAARAGIVIIGGQVLRVFQSAN